MKNKALHLPEYERITALSFDEMHVSSQICINKVQEEIMGTHTIVQVIMALGLLLKWKQPVYFNFDNPMTEPILKEVVNLESSEYQVYSVTSDLGPSNRNLTKSLGICETKPSIINPKYSFFFADGPHLLKLIRNHFLDKGFILETGEKIDTSTVQCLLHYSLSDLKLTYKVTQTHLNVTKSQRQKVKKAVQLFSRSVSKVVTFCGERNIIEGTGKTTATFIELENDWFDIFNSNFPYNANKGKSAYVLLRNLFTDFAVKYPIKYLLTTKLNQDILETLFPFVSVGITHDHPTPLEFITYRIRSYILGKHPSEMFTLSENSSVDNANTFTLDELRAMPCITEYLLVIISDLNFLIWVNQLAHYHHLCFVNFHGDYFRHEGNVIQSVTDIVLNMCSEFLREVIYYFVKTRTYIR
ncbi:hypothetical protein PR048_001080, partial [Dryococelus australis]